MPLVDRRVPGPYSRSVVLIEDDPVMGGALTQRLALERYRVDWHRTGREAMDALRTHQADAIVCDIRLPDIGGEDLYAALRSSQPAAPVIFVTAYGEIDQAVRLVKAGAADYLTKPFEVRVLLERLAGLMPADAVAGVMGPSPAMRMVEATLRRVAGLDSTLLITGESGVGKEVAARLTHSASDRAAEPFVAVNCAAIPDNLIESELFGHERGAFTGAERTHQGYLERAGKGTLFLDEVGDLPSATQTKLLRVLQEREFTRLGAQRSQRLAARVICATHRDLQALVRDGRFREDLFYRIAVIPVAIPPLRQRRDDILPLLRAAVGEFSESFARPVYGISPDAEHLAEEHAWPGNVRELRNRAERAVALSSAPTIQAADLFPESPARPSGDVLPSLAEVRLQAEHRHIARVLEATGGQVEEAARRLRISRSAMFEKLKRLRA